MQSDTPIYRIRLRGHLSERRAQRFEAMMVSPLPDGDTLITGPVRDQAALHAILGRIHDMGIALIEVARIEPGAAEGIGDASRT